MRDRVKYMNSRPTDWLNSISMRDPIKRRMAVIVQTMLISLSVTTILGSLLWLLSEGSLENSLRPMLLSLLIVLFMVAALAILRSGRLETSVLLATSGLLLAL